MQLSFFTLIALFALAAVRAVPAGQPSEVPSCTYTCPPQDVAGFPLGTNSNDGTTLFCSYPAYQGENPNDFFCNYSSLKGGLTENHDAGFCPNSAVASCSTRRRNALSQPPASPKEAPVALAPVFAPNDKMKVRALLKKRRARIPSSSSS